MPGTKDSQPTTQPGSGFGRSPNSRNLMIGCNRLRIDADGSAVEEYRIETADWNTGFWQRHQEAPTVTCRGSTLRPNNFHLT